MSEAKTSYDRDFANRTNHVLGVGRFGKVEQYGLCLRRDHRRGSLQAHTIASRQNQSSAAVMQLRGNQTADNTGPAEHECPATFERDAAATQLTAARWSAMA